MRLLMLSLGLHPDLDGGAYRYVADLAAEWVRSGHEVDVICPSPRLGLPPDSMSDGGYRVLRYPDARGPFWWNWWAENRRARRLLLEALSRGPARVILAHAFLAPSLPTRESLDVWALFTGPWAEEYLASGPGTLKRKVLASLMRRVEGRVLERCRGILTLSDYYLRQLPLWHPGRSLPPTHAILGGVDTRRFQPLSAEARVRVRKRLGWGSGDKVFLAVRRLAPRMGLEGLLEAFRLVVERHETARLVLVGRGALEGRLRHLIQSGTPRFRNAVQLAGFVEESELPDWIGAADVQLMPSLDLEGFGLSTVEALACGVPVLGSDAGATPELLDPWRDTCVVKTGDVQAWSSALRDILEGNRRLPDAAACRARVLQHFTWPQVANRIANIPSWS